MILNKHVSIQSITYPHYIEGSKNIAVAKDFTLECIENKHLNEIYKKIDKHREYLAKFLPWAKSINKSGEQNFILDCMEKAEEKTAFTYVIRVNKDLVGCIDLHNVIQPKEGVLGSAEFGYYLFPEYQGKGYCVQAVKALSALFYVNHEITRFVIKTRVDNFPSQAVAEKVGAHLEGIERSSLVPSYCYSYLLPEDLFSQNKELSGVVSAKEGSQEGAGDSEAKNSEQGKVQEREGLAQLDDTTIGLAECKKAQEVSRLIAEICYQFRDAKDAYEESRAQEAQANKEKALSSNPENNQDSTLVTAESTTFSPEQEGFAGSSAIIPPEDNVLTDDEEEFDVNKENFKDGAEVLGVMSNDNATVANNSTLGNSESSKVSFTSSVVKPPLAQAREEGQLSFRSSAASELKPSSPHLDQSLSQAIKKARTNFNVPHYDEDFDVEEEGLTDQVPTAKMMRSATTESNIELVGEVKILSTDKKIPREDKNKEEHNKTVALLETSLSEAKK